mgnify:CR=1 FL=1
MASSYTSRIRLEKQADGENPNSWGLIMNQNVIDLVDEAIAGYQTVSVSSATVSLTNNNGSSDQSRNFGLKLEGALTADVTVGIPSQEKIYFVFNNTTGNNDVLFKTVGGTAVTATSQGQGMMMACDGTNINKFEGGFDSGTKMLFQQTTAPSGWTKDTTNYNNHALRVVTGTVGNGGSVDFSTAFASQSVSGSISNTVSGSTAGHTLTIAEMPSHNHTGVVQQREDFNPTTGSTTQSPLGFGDTRGGSRASASPLTIDNTGGGGSHSHDAGSLAVSSTFSGNAIDLSVKYVDIIICTKD